MPTMPNPTGKHRRKRRHPGEGSVILRRDRWRAKPWAAVVPYLDESGRRREMWLSAASRAEADELRKAEVAKLRRGVVPSDLTVTGYVADWLSTLDVGPGTYPRYLAHLEQRITPTVGDVALSRLQPAQVRRAVIEWSGAPATRAGALRLLRAAMRQAMADHLIEHDPTAGIPYPRSVQRMPRALTGEQARDLMAAVEGERYAPILVVSLGLGLRRGEALGLRPSDIDFPAGTVTIAQSLRRIDPSLRAPDEGTHRLTTTKSRRGRVLPLPGFVAVSLRDRLAERDQERRAAKVWASNELVFCDPRGNAIPVNTLGHWWGRVVVRQKLAGLRWHDLRRSTATVLIENGVDIETVRRILGHRDIATTLRYVGETPEALRGAAEKIGRAMGR